MIKKKSVSKQQNYRKLINLALSIINNTYTDAELQNYKQFSIKSPLCLAIKLKGRIIAHDGIFDTKIPIYEKVLYTARIAGIESNKIHEKDKKHISIEIALLSKPKLLKVSHPEEYLKKIVIGRDGLLLPKQEITAVLMPYYGIINPKTTQLHYLEELCRRAELEKNDWKDLTNKIYIFSIKKIIK
ncbi:AMMECR1 domain-containing protein [Candidatus Woesearchaeota archaeon]|nr:AMMECR1 domain-containing protein [Candidatus Woesearchaeota archaeon]